MVQKVSNSATTRTPSALAVFGWLFIAAITATNGWLAYQAMQFQFGGGYSAAQADFELFSLIITVGVPIALLAFFLLVVFALSNLRTPRFLASMARNPSVLLCVVNVLVPIGLLLYALSVKGT